MVAINGFAIRQIHSPLPKICSPCKWLRTLDMPEKGVQIPLGKHVQALFSNKKQYLFPYPFSVASHQYTVLWYETVWKDF